MSRQGECDVSASALRGDSPALTLVARWKRAAHRIRGHASSDGPHVDGAWAGDTVVSRPRTESVVRRMDSAVRHGFAPACLVCTS